MPRSDETIAKNIKNWLHGTHLPSKDSIQEISREENGLASYCKTLKPSQISSLLHIAKLLTRFFKWAKEYFGAELCDVLVARYRFVNAWSFLHKINLANFILHDYAERLPIAAEALLRLNDKCDHGVFGWSLLEEGKEWYEEREWMLEQHKNYICSLFEIKEESFFENIDFFIPVRAFMPNNVSVEWQSYHESFRECMKNPKMQHIKILTDLEFQDFVNKEYDAYRIIRNKLFTFINPNNLDEVGFNEIVQELNEVAIYENNPYISWMQGDFHACKAGACKDKKEQKEILETAQKYYLHALQHGKGVMGKNYKHMIEEGMAVSAMLTRQDEINVDKGKAPFTKFYKEAYFVGLVSQEAEDVAYLVQDFRFYFEKTFCKDSMQEEDLGQKENKKDFWKITPNFAGTTMEKIDSIKIDFSKPNKIIEDVYPNPVFQLMHTCFMLDVENTKKLLDSGADVNRLRGDRGSALIFALNGFENNMCQDEKELQLIREKTRMICKLLIPKMSKESLNTRTNKRKISALSLAIELGLTEVVRLLRDYGTDMESQTCTQDNVSPLYWCLLCIANAHYKTPPLHSLNKEQIIKTMRGTLGESLFDEITLNEFYHRFASEESLERFETIKKVYLARYVKCLPAYYEIFDILLDSVKNIDSVQTNMNHFTPLLLAVELGEIALVKKLLAKGANKEHKNNKGENAYVVAKNFHPYNIELLNLLR